MKKGILLLMVTAFVFSVSAQNRNRYTESRNENYREEVSKKSSRGQRSSNYNKKNSSRKTNELNRLDRITDKDYFTYSKKKKNNNYKGGKNSKNNYSKHYNNKRYNVNYNKNYSRGVVVCNDYSRRVKYLPNNFVKVRLNGLTLFFTDGIFYKNHGGYYQEVIPPVGAVVYQLPLYAERVSIDGRIYYEYHNTLFKKIETNRGYAFEVVGQLNWN